MNRVQRLCSATVASALVLFLCACHSLTTDPFVIEPADRAVVPDLEGEFWLLGSHERAFDSSVSRIRIRHDDLGQTIISGVSSGDKQDTDPVSLLDLGHDGIFLTIFSFEGGRSADGSVQKPEFDYNLLVRADQGTWWFVGELGHTDSLFEGTRLAHLANVAKRYEVRVPTDEDVLMFGSPLSVEKVRALFADPEFLAGILIRPDLANRLLPLNPVPGAADIPLPDDPVSPMGPLSSPEFPLDPRSLAQPAELIGDFILSQRADCDMRVSIAPRGDGRLVFTLKAPSPLRGHDELMVMGLLPGSVPDTFVGLVEHRELAGSSGWVRRFRYVMVEFNRNLRTATISWILTADPPVSAAFVRIVQGVRQGAAAQYGMRYEKGQLDGALEAGPVQELLADPRFHLGLELDTTEDWTLHLEGAR